ncbi:MAG TPA: hypothetical protein VE994_07855 [Terriglobales bacterium]|nr:hypothetical protein [Terriglobales bacterium]
MNLHTRSAHARKGLFHPGAQAVLYGIVVLAFLCAADQVSMYFGLTGSERVIDDICGAIIAGVLVYWNERRRVRFLTEKLKTIELLNHHVRNALQVITYSVYRQGNTEQVAEIQDAVNRIDWALREILPGHDLDTDNYPKKPSQPTPRNTATA